MFDFVKKIIVKVFSIFFVVSADIDSQNSINVPSDNLSECRILDLYGFNTEKKIRAIDYILKGAGIVDSDSDVHDYLKYCSDNKINAETIYKFVKDSQEKLSLRSGSIERWDVANKKIQWKNNTTEDGVLQSLRDLGFVDPELSLNFSGYDAIGILGATGNTMEKRVRFADGYVKDDVKIVLLTGERDCNQKIEKKFIDKFREKHNTNDVVFENDIFKDIVQESDKMKNNEIIVINTKKSPEGARPNTYTTALDFFKESKNHGIKKVLFISNQPYVNYQKAVIDAAFLRACKDEFIAKEDLEYSIAGGVDEGQIVNIDAGCKELGSFIFAQTPLVLSECNIQKHDIGEDFNKFVEKGHVFQQVLPEVFSR